MAERDPLANIGFISIRSLQPALIGDFAVDPEIRLPIELPQEGQPFRAESITWQAIISAMLRLLAYKPDAEHAGYYRRFIMAVHPQIKEEFTRAGIEKAQAGQPDLAIEIFRSMAGLFPDSGETWNNLALVYEQKAKESSSRGDQARAEEFRELVFAAYKTALAADPQLAACHLNFAHFYLARGNAAKAREHFDLFLKYNHDLSRAENVREISRRLETMGRLEQACAEAFDAINLGQEREAISTLTCLLSQHPDLWNAWFLLGWAHRRLAQYAEGKKAFLKALQLNARNADALNELAICLMELGELEECRQRLNSALQLDPENTKILSNLGILALRLGEEVEAKRIFEAILALHPDDPIALRYMGFDSRQ